MWVDELAFERAAVEARTIQEQTGFLPALDDPRLKVREILLWFPLEGDGPIDGLLRMQQPGDYATRAVVAATLYSLIGDNPYEETRPCQVPARARPAAIAGANRVQCMASWRRTPRGGRNLLVGHRRLLPRAKRYEEQADLPSALPRPY